jgi:NADPH:quinone reductase-like Zn-dependent oxidoreductase
LRGVVSIAYSVWFERPGEAALRREPLREPAAGEVRVRAICSAVSAGVERLVLRGEVPPEAHELVALPSMRGRVDLPVAYPAALVGTVEAAGPGVPGERLGERVLLIHPHQDVVVVKAEALVPLPDAPPAARLTLAPGLEVALEAVWDAEIALGDRVVVTGLGVIGLLVAWLARRAGAAAVLGVDPDPDRAALGLALGATEATRSASASARALAEADVLIEASGAPAALADLLAHAGPGARIVVVSWYGRAGASLPLGGRFLPPRASLRASGPPLRARAPRRLALVRDLLGDEALDRLIAPPVPLSEAAALYDELGRGVAWIPPHRVIDPRR